jgi:hypothetical protein
LTGFDLFLFLFEDHLDLSDSHFLLLFFLLNFLDLFLQILVDFFDGSLLVSLVLLDFVLFLLELFHVLNSGLLESNLVVVLHLLVESLSGLIDLSLDSRNLFAEFLLLILQLFDKRIGLQLLLDFGLDDFVFWPQLFGVLAELIDLLLILLDSSNSIFFLDVELILLRLDLIHDRQVLNSPVDDSDLGLLLRNLVLKTAVGFTVLDEFVVLLHFLLVNGGQFILLPSLVEVKLGIELSDLLPHEIDLLLEILLHLMKIFVGGNEVLFLLVVIFDLLHDLLEFLVGKHVLFDPVLDALQVLVFEVDLLLEILESILQLFLVGSLDTSLLVGQLWNFLFFVKLLFSLLFPVFGPLSSGSLVLLFLSDFVFDSGVKGLFILTDFFRLVALYCHL